MTALGPIAGVRRTRYHDDDGNLDVYPLDSKINLLIIGGTRSRYTQVFSHNAARLYAELTEADAAEMLNNLLCVDIDKASLSDVAQAVSTSCRSPFDRETSEDADAAVQCAVDVSEPDRDGEGVGGDGEKFLSKRLDELLKKPDRDTVIQDAIDGKLEGAEAAPSSPVAKTVVYAMADGTGVPGLKKELSENGKGDGGAKTFEAKIGSVFRQGFSAEGLPMLYGGDIARLPDTTKYTGTVGKIDQFDPQFAEFTERHGVHSDDQIVFIGDGALWIWNMQRKLFPNAICVIDFFHAAEHLNGIVDALTIFAIGKRKEFREKCHHLLELGEIDQLVSLIRGKMRKHNEKQIEKRLAYFTENADKMRYGLFKAAGMFVGSGVIEAACKTIVGKRMKNAGMHWSKKNAEGVIALRCAIYSGEFDSQAA